jgi:hypothetical protein
VVAFGLWNAGWDEEDGEGETGHAPDGSLRCCGDIPGTPHATTVDIGLDMNNERRMPQTY